MTHWFDEQLPNWGKVDQNVGPCPSCGCSKEEHKMDGGIHSKDCECRMSQHYWDD